MTAQVNIVLGNVKGALTIPSAALGAAEPDGRYKVRVVGKDGTLSDRNVAVGLNNKVNAEVLSGLEEGERVVTGEVSTQATMTSSDGPGGPPMGF